MDDEIAILRGHVVYLTQSISQLSLKTGEEGIQANAGGSSGEESEVNGPEKTRLLWGVRTVSGPIGYRTGVDMKAAGERDRFEHGGSSEKRVR